MGGQRVIYEEVIRRLEKIEGSYNIKIRSEILEFKGSKSIIKHQCIQCGKNKKSTLKNLENGWGFMCKECVNKKQSNKKRISQEDILQRIKEIDSSIIKEYGISSEPIIKFYNGTESIIEHTCLRCRTKKDSNFGNYKKKSGLICRECMYKKISSDMMRDFYYLESELIYKHGDCEFKPEGEYKGVDSIFSFYCSTCKSKEKRSYRSLIVGYMLCDECLCIQRASKLSISKYEVKKIIESKNCKWAGGEYKNNQSKLVIECPCGNKYKCTLSEFKKGQTICNKCSKYQSLGEALLEEVIYFYCKEFNYTYKYQKSFSDLKSDKGTVLRFDFEISNYGNIIMLIEFNGEQHYRFIEYFHKKVEDFIEQQKNDSYKQDYCKNKRYKFLVIKYIDLYKCQEILMDKLNFSDNLRAKFYNTIDEIRKQLWKSNNILVFSIYKKYIGSFRSISDVQLYFAKKNIKISHGEISCCLSNKRNSAKKLIFIYNSDLDKLDLKIEHLKKKYPSLYYMVKLIPIENNNEFFIMSVQNAKLFLEVNKTSRITQVCHKNKKIDSDKRYYIKGYICEWYDCPPYEVCL